MKEIGRLLWQKSFSFDLKLKRLQKVLVFYAYSACLFIVVFHVT